MQDGDMGDMGGMDGYNDQGYDPNQNNGYDGNQGIDPNQQIDPNFMGGNEPPGQYYDPN